LLALKLTLLLWFLPPANEYRFFLDIRSPFHMAVSGLMIGVGCRFLWHDVRVQNALRRVRHGEHAVLGRNDPVRHAVRVDHSVFLL
jgi:hypothetical protein